MQTKKIKIIILDRDGVINYDSPDFVKTPSEWQAIPGSLEAIAKLNQAGYKVAVATNQSGIARGYFTAEILEQIHQKMQNELAKVGGHLDGIFVCPHHPDENCACRKPKPGLFLQIQKFFNCKKDEILAIGDSIRDLEAAQNFGCVTILVKTGNGSHTLKGINKDKNKFSEIPVFKDLAEAVDDLC